MGRPGRWIVAGLMTLAAFAVTTCVTEVFLFTQWLPSPDTRWSTVAVTTGAAVAAFIGLWGQSWATESGGQGSRPILANQLAPHERRERKARDQLRQHLGRQDQMRRMDETSALALRVHPAIAPPRPLEPTAALRAEKGRLQGPILLQTGCDRACRHRPARHAGVCQAGRAARAAPPEHRHRCGDRATRRHRRTGRAPGGCAEPKVAPENQVLRSSSGWTASRYPGSSRMPAASSPH